MIVDWEKQCKKIFETKLLDTEAIEDRKHVVLQEIRYVAYLKDKLNMTWDEVFEEWRSLKNGRASISSGDTEWLVAEFRKNVVHEYEKYIRDNCDYTKKMMPAVFYVDEINLINSQDVPRWCKIFWFSLLANYKFVSQQKNIVYKTKTVEKWALRMSGTKYNTVNVRETQWWGYFKNIFVTQVVKSKIAYEPSELMKKHSDKVAVVIEDINDLTPGFKLLNERTRTCEKCGNIFYISSGTKSTVCAKCRKGLHKIICTSCGTIFEGGAKCKRTLCETCYKGKRKQHNLVGITLLSEKGMLIGGNTQENGG